MRPRAHTVSCGCLDSACARRHFRDATSPTNAHFRSSSLTDGRTFAAAARRRGLCTEGGSDRPTSETALSHLRLIMRRTDGRTDGGNSDAVHLPTMAVRGSLVNRSATAPAKRTLFIQRIVRGAERERERGISRSPSTAACRPVDRRRSSAALLPNKSDLRGHSSRHALGVVVGASC